MRFDIAIVPCQVHKSDLSNISPSKNQPVPGVGIFFPLFFKIQMLIKNPRICKLGQTRNTFLSLS